MFIKDNSIWIRNAVMEDATILCQWWNDGDIMSHAGFYDGIHTT